MAMLMTLSAQTPMEGKAKVIHIKGNARYSTGNNVWQPLRVGAKLKPGTLIQTAANSYVDLALGDGEAPVGGGGAAANLETVSYQPTAEQNLVRIFDNSVLSVDKLTSMETGADVVTETQLDLKAGRIMGNVKKMSAASKYEVKLPNGVAGIRGTVFYLSADGKVRVTFGSLVFAYVKADTTVATQVVMTGQQFDSSTGQITPISALDMQTMNQIRAEAKGGEPVPPMAFARDHTIHFVSPTENEQGENNNNQGQNQP